ncbi:MAG: hypothetical protein ACYC9U_00245 [Nitrososphaerales archaeon]
MIGKHNIHGELVGYEVIVLDKLNDDDEKNASRSESVALLKKSRVDSLPSSIPSNCFA